jgi:hypothetical protein
MSLERSLKFLSGHEQNLVKPGTEIQFRKPSSIAQFIHKLIKYRHRKLGLGCKSVEVTKVHTKFVGAIFLFD